MAKSNLFGRIRTRATRTGKQVKFAAVKLGADLSSFVPAPQSLLERLGIKKAFVPAGARPSVRSTIVTPTMLRKARLEAEEGRTLSPTEAKRIRGGKRYVKSYLKQKLRLDPRLGDPSLYHPDFWNMSETFQWNWERDQRRFLRLALERTGFHYELTETGEWIKTEVPGASRKVMSADDWAFYVHHYFANYALWYLDQHDLTDDPMPSARNKRPGTPSIYIEHRPFLFGAGNDHHQYFLTADGEWTENSHKARTKTPLSGYKSLNAIADLKKMFPNAIFVTFAFGYDVAQILRCLDADTAGKLQAGEIVISSVDDDGAPCEEVVEQAVFFWKEFAISYRRGKML